MKGYIYKITNLINNKIYIGKTETNIKQRFNRHCREALKNKGCPLLQKAIRKYGSENFMVEELERCDDKEKLCEAEINWIEKLKSTNREIGYNLTKGGEGGNTYVCKTNTELQEIKRKLSLSKEKQLNPHASPVKCMNVLTKKEVIFSTQKECQDYFGETNHNFITRRVSGKTKCLYKKVWNIAYLNQDYFNLTPNKQNYNSVKIEIYDNGRWIQFVSFSSLEKSYNFPRNSLTKKFNREKKTNIIYKDYPIRFFDKCVSTNPDECRGVGQEIGTCSKEEALEIEKI